MYNIKSMFIAGDVPGDPELGGWRPLPKSFFRNSGALSDELPITTLEQAVQAVAFKVRYLCLHRATRALAVRLWGN
jgi:hypothetical protein